MSYQDNWEKEGYPDSFNFEFNSAGTWGSLFNGTRSTTKVIVTSEPIYESIGEDGTDTPYYQVTVKFETIGDYSSSGSYEYELDIDTMEAWQNNPSMTFYRSKIRQSPDNFSDPR